MATTAHDLAKPDMADMPVQLPAAPRDAAGARARFFNSGNAFNIKLAPVPPRVFAAEAERALASPRRTGLIPCDGAAAMGMPGPATTPLMLASYAAIAPGETLGVELRATGSIWYVIAGRGTVSCPDAPIAWTEGDVLLLPGGERLPFTAGPEGAVLWFVSNEPQLAFDGAVPPPPDRASIKPVHYPAAEIERQIGLIYEASPNEATSGMALIFSSEEHEASRNIAPSLTLSLNTLPAASDQRTHRHNAAAITLVVQGADSFSIIGDSRAEWAPWATLVTPPGTPHSHHNGHPTRRALFLIVQDGGLHYHARTMDFAFLG